MYTYSKQVILFGLLSSCVLGLSCHPRDLIHRASKNPSQEQQSAFKLFEGTDQIIRSTLAVSADKSCSVVPGEPRIACWGHSSLTAEHTGAQLIGILGQQPLGAPFPALPVEVTHGPDGFFVLTSNGQVYAESPLEGDPRGKFPAFYPVATGIKDIAGAQMIGNDGKLSQLFFNNDSYQVLALSDIYDQGTSGGTLRFKKFVGEHMPYAFTSASSDYANQTHFLLQFTNDPATIVNSLTASLPEGTSLGDIKILAGNLIFPNEDVCYVSSDNRLICRGNRDILGMSQAGASAPSINAMAPVFVPHPFETSDPIVRLHVDGQRLCINTLHSGSLKLYCSGLPLGSSWQEDGVHHGEFSYLFGSFRDSLTEIDASATGYPSDVTAFSFFDLYAPSRGRTTACVQQAGTGLKIRCLGMNAYRSTLVGQRTTKVTPFQTKGGRLGLGSEQALSVSKFTEVQLGPSEAILSKNVNLKIVGYGLFESTDGHTDILMRDQSSGFTWIMKEGEAGITGYLKLVHQVTDMRWKVVGTVDMNRDGFTDIIWQYAPDKRVVVWFMDGNGTRLSSKVIFSGNPNMHPDWHVVAVADVTKDAFNPYNDASHLYAPDLVWRHATNGKNSIWVYDHEQNHIASVPLNNNGNDVVASHFDIVGIDDSKNPYVFWRNTQNGDVYVWKLTAVRASNLKDITEVKKVDGKLFGNAPINWEAQFAAGKKGVASIYWKNLSSPAKFTKWYTQSLGVGGETFDYGRTGGGSLFKQ